MLRVSLILPSPSKPYLPVLIHRSNISVVQGLFLTLLLTLGAIAVDYLAAPTLYSSSPFWATAACLLLVWRRGTPATKGNAIAEDFGVTPMRIVLFSLGHGLLILAGRALHSTLEPIASAVSLAGWTIAALKLSILLPTVVLLPLARWRILAGVYAAEAVAALVVLFTFFPGRILVTIWPWYAQMLGRLVFGLGGLFVPGLTYTGVFMPVIHGPDLDVTILFACSGISGIELFDYLFAFVVVLDWNRLLKSRTLIAYFVGVAAMFLSNALRIACFVVFGNRGFGDVVARFHLSAGWIFFSVVFLAYLSLSYRRLLASPR